MFDTDFISTALKTEPIILGKGYNRKIDGFSINSRDIQKGQCFIGIKGDNFDGNMYANDAYKKGSRVFILDKSRYKKIKDTIKDGVIFPVKNTIEALGDLARYYKNQIFASVLAITGSSGKTTTRSLINIILSRKFNIHTAKKNLNNDIGLPLTMLDATPDTHIMILEMGMNHVGEIEYLSDMCKPLVSIITNIGYAHIGPLGSLDKIADAKSEIYYGMSKRGFVFLNLDDDYYEYLASKSPAEVIVFSINDLQIVKDKGLDGYRINYKGTEFDYPLPGKHNLSNLALALKIAEFYRVTPENVVAAISDYVTIAGRTNIIRSKNVTIIDDCYNANPSSMTAALDLLSKTKPKGKRVAVLADMLELGLYAGSLHKKVGNYIVDNKCADLVLGYGEHTRLLIKTVKNSGIKAEWYKTSAGLVNGLTSKIDKGDVVLVKASRGMKLEDVVKALS